MPIAKISPSMLSSDFAFLAAEAKRMTKNGADWLHLGKPLFISRVPLY
jgi:ribulose-phosphate 3-epimerase